MKVGEGSSSQIPGSILVIAARFLSGVLEALVFLQLQSGSERVPHRVAGASLTLSRGPKSLRTKLFGFSGYCLSAMRAWSL